MGHNKRVSDRRVSNRRQADRLAASILLQLESIRSILTEMEQDCTKKVTLADGQHTLIEITLQDAEKLARLQLVKNK